MVLNPSKTKLMIVNFTVDHQYQSLLTIPGSSSPIELAFETKLLGYWLTVNMRPDKHIEYILRIAYSRLWAISWLKSTAVSDGNILHFYQMKIRSALEYSSPVFTPMLTAQNIDDIERVQKIVLKVILDSKYLNYDQACQTLLTESLQSRRKTLALKFALNTYSCSEDLHTTNWGIWSHLRNHSAIPRGTRTLLCHTWLVFLMITLPRLRSHIDRDYFNVSIFNFMWTIDMYISYHW